MNNKYTGFTEAQREYIDYLERVNYTQDRPLEELNREALNREVGKAYGLTEQDMDSTVASYVMRVEV